MLFHWWWYSWTASDTQQFWVNKGVCAHLWASELEHGRDGCLLCVSLEGKRFGAVLNVVFSFPMYDVFFYFVSS